MIFMTKFDQIEIDVHDARDGVFCFPNQGLMMSVV